MKNKIETLTSHILTPYPGTELYRQMESSGRITDYDLSKYNTANVLFNLLYRKFGKITSAISRIIPMNILGKLGAKISYKLK